MAYAPQIPTRMKWLVIALAMAMAPVVYGAVIALTFDGGARSASSDMLMPRMYFWIGAAAAITLSILSTHFRLRMPINEAVDAGPPSGCLRPTSSSCEAPSRWGWPKW